MIMVVSTVIVVAAPVQRMRLVYVVSEELDA